MKISILISVLILAVASVFGWKNHQELSALRVEFRMVAEKAAELGISIDDVEEGKLLRSPLTREREDREAETKAFAVEIIAFARKMKEREENGGGNDEEFQKETTEVIRRFLDLDAKQLKDLVAELEGSSEIDDEMREGIVGFSIMMLANESPESALSLFAESSAMLDMDGMGKHVIESSLSRLAEKDPFKALDWIRENGKSDPDLVTDATKSAVISGAAKLDLAMAIRLMDELDIENRHSAVDGIAKAANSSDERLSVLETLRGLEDGKDLKQEVLGSLGRQMVKDGYESSAEWLSKAEMSGEELENFGQGLNYRDTQEDTGKWLEWLGETHSGEKSSERTERLMSDWTRNDFQAAGTWLNDAEDGPLKSAAVASYAKTVAPYEPEAAAKWVGTLPKGKERKTLAQQVYQEWKKKDEAAAAAFAAKQGIE